ncbi:MAG: hypothetical protein KatS3mg105_4255 [Gemmatales bacterium]|nr:MAG: hypothetical protein KatS3mg105_4255 [Gemmatales bacterium]
MKPKTIILMGVAIACGLVASFMVKRYMSEREQKVWVLAAKSHVPQWGTIQEPEATFEPMEVPKSQIQGDVIGTLAGPDGLKDYLKQLKNRQIKKPGGITKGQFIAWSDLVEKEKQSLDAVVPKGKRAMAVQASAHTAASGLILPNSHVDLLYIPNDRTGEPEYVLENVKVLSINQEINRKPDRNGMIPSTVTLEVTPEQAKDVGAVINKGQLLMTLRPVGDDSVLGKKPKKKPEPKVELPPPKVEPKPVVVVDKPKPPPEFKVKQVLTNGQDVTIQYAVFHKETGEFLRYEPVTSEQGNNVASRPKATPQPKTTGGAEPKTGGPESKEPEPKEPAPEKAPAGTPVGADQ